MHSLTNFSLVGNAELVFTGTIRVSVCTLYIRVTAYMLSQYKKERLIDKQCAHNYSTCTKPLIHSWQNPWDIHTHTHTHSHTQCALSCNNSARVTCANTDCYRADDYCRRPLTTSGCETMWPIRSHAATAFFSLQKNTDQQLPQQWSCYALGLGVRRVSIVSPQATESHLNKLVISEAQPVLTQLSSTRPGNPF